MEVTSGTAARSGPSEQQPASRLMRLLRSPQRAWQFSEGIAGPLGYYACFGLGMIRGNYLWQKALTTYGRHLGRTGEHNFLILGAMRSGTTALVDYLNCHPKIQCRGEILNTDYVYYGNPRRMGTQRLKLHVESFFVKRTNVLLGAKVLTYQFDDMPIKLGDLIETLQQPRIIVLYRQQMLEQYASLKLAERAGVWHSNKRGSDEPIWLDPDDFVAFAQRERRMWRESLAALSDSRVHFLTCEELVERPREAMQGVFAFLGQTCCPVEAFVAKMHSRPLSEKVANYREFARRGILDDAVLQLPAQDAGLRKSA